MTELSLFEHQEKAVDDLRAAIRAGHKRIVLVAPTGAGKTEIATYMLKAKRARSLFIVDRVTLVDQTSERFDKYGLDHGIIQADHWRRGLYSPLKVCSAQSLERRGMPEDSQLIFVDEAHSMRKKVTAFIHSTEAIVIGLTATPFTRGMGAVYTHVVNVSTTNELIRKGKLVPLRIYAARAINVEGMKVVAGEWSEKDIESRGMEILGDIVSEWQQKTAEHFGGPVKTIVFSATVKHGEEICRQFRDAGFNFVQVSYKDGGDDERRAVIEEFRKPDSEIHGLVSCEVFTKGFDVSDVMCGISARPYRKSLSSHMQQLGRVMRTAPGKEYGLWLDHSGNALRFHKDVQEVFESGCGTLDEGAKRDAKARKEPTKRERDAIRCACGCVLNAWDKACPACGKERKRQALIETKPGQMVEVSAKPAPNGLDDRDSVWRQLCHGARIRYPGDVDRAKRVAFAQYRDLFGKLPGHLAFDRTTVEPMSEALRKRLRYLLIKFSKSPNRQPLPPVPIYNA